MKEFLEKHKIYIIVVVLISLVLFNFIINSQKTAVIENKTSNDKTASNDINPTRIKVDLKGCIKKPGVYEFLDYQRVVDAIDKAGGLTEEADTSNINLSKVLEDEMVIYVSSKEEIKNKETSESSENLLVEQAVLPDYEVPEKNITSTKISLNKASLEELMTLPKIGESKAKAIIEYRNKSPFNSIEDLKKVSGIGEATYELLKDQIVL